MSNALAIAGVTAVLKDLLDTGLIDHRVTDALNRGWQLHGQPTLTFDQKRGEVICGQLITKEIEDTPYDPGMDLSTL